MGANGYGPAQYALLLDEALAFEPKVIIASYDYGDDIYDSYRFVYRIGDVKRSTLDTVFDSSFALTSLQSRETLTRAESIDPAFLRRKYLNCSKPIEVTDSRLQVSKSCMTFSPLLLSPHSQRRWDVAGHNGISGRPLGADTSVKKAPLSNSRGLPPC
jgi:hypothetical protein